MSEYVYAMRYDENGCPECGGENTYSKPTRFSCADCDFQFP
jgi:rRNA maturation protein Nop10